MSGQGLIITVPACGRTRPLLLSVGVLLVAGKKLGTVVVNSIEEARALMEWHSRELDQLGGRPLRIWPLDNLRHSCLIQQQQRAIQAMPEGDMCFLG